MATHSSILAWEIPQIEEPGGLYSVGLQRVRHDSSHLARKYILSPLGKKKKVPMENIMEAS